MAIFDITQEGLRPLESTTLIDAGLSERHDLQQMLRRQIEVVAPGTLVISEEFSSWADSRRRIDLLAIDRDGSLVVIEIKRTEDGGHMELQALRYAAMVSTMTFDQAVETYQRYLDSGDEVADARERILEFLEWEAEDEDAFAQDIRIVLVSGEFSKEITTTVLWLNQRGLDIRCVRLRPYRDGAKTLVDIQQVIPLPEAEEYQVQMQQKVRSELVSRRQGRDFTKYTVTVADKEYTNLPKRWAVYRVVRALFEAGEDPQAMREAVSWRTNMMRVVDGELSKEEFETHLVAQLKAEGVQPSLRRYFTGDDELMRHAGKTYALSNQWGRFTDRAIQDLLSTFRGHHIFCTKEPTSP